MPKRKVFARTSVEGTLKLLDDAAAQEPEKPEQLTVQETLEVLGPKINEMWQRGYTLEHIVRILRNGLGEAFGLPDLKKYFEPTKRRKRRAAKTGAQKSAKPDNVSLLIHKPQATPRNDSRMTADELRKRS